MSRRQQQQRLRKRVEHTRVRPHDLRFLAVMGAGGDPHRMPVRQPRPQRPGARLPVIGQLCGELEIPDNSNPLRLYAQPHEPQAIAFGLRQHPCRTAERVAHQAADAAIAAQRLLRQTRIHQVERCCARCQAGIEIRPQLRLHEQRHRRPQRRKETLHRTRQIVGQITAVHAVAEQLPHGLAAARRRHGHQQRGIGITHTQRADQGLRGPHLADRDGMQPDRAGYRRQVATEPFPPVTAIVGFAPSPEPQTQQHHRQQQVQQQ